MTFPPPPPSTPPPPPAPPRKSNLVPLLIVGTIAVITLMAGAAAAIMLVMMNSGAFSPAPPMRRHAAGDAGAAARCARRARAGRGGGASAPRSRRRRSAIDNATPLAIAPDAAARQAAVERARRTTEGEEPVERAVRVGGNVLQPRKTRNVQPVYPQIAQSARVQGRVIIEATIDRSGKVTETRVLRSIPLLDQAALDAVRQWEYEPTLLNGVPVPVIMTVTVNFALRR